MRFSLALISIFVVSASAAMAQIQASVLPVSRSAVTGQPVTVFATVINSGDQTVTNCSVSLADTIATDFAYQRFDIGLPAPHLAGSPDAPFDIVSDGRQDLLLTFTPTSDFDRQEIDLDFACDERTAPRYSGVNTVFLSSSAIAESDIIPIAVTPQGGGLMQFDRESRRSAFAVAAINIGAAGAVRVRPSAPNIAASVSLRICETNPANGQCFAPPGESVLSNFAESQTHTYTIVVEADEGFGVPAHYDVTRVFLIFEGMDPAVSPGAYGSPIIPARPTYGATSIAVSALGPWQQNESGNVFGVHRGTLNGQPALIFMDSFRGGFGIQFNHPADAAEIDGTFPLVLGTMDAVGDLFQAGNLVLSGGNETIGSYSYTELQDVRGVIGSQTALNFSVTFRGAYDPSHNDPSLAAAVGSGNWTVRLPDRAIGTITIDEENAITGTVTWPVMDGGTETPIAVTGSLSRSETQNEVNLSLYSDTVNYRFTGFVDARPGGNVLTGYVQDVGASVAPGTSTPADFDVIPIELIPDAE